jgi:3-isopropylmalate/(R)-2-methylmalate dehydratase small subunit
MLFVTTLEPQVVEPPLRWTVNPVTKYSGIKINRAYIGTCFNSRIEDMRITARILKGRKVHPDVCLSITQGSLEVLKQSSQEGFIEIFADAECELPLPCCGMCGGFIIAGLNMGCGHDHESAPLSIKGCGVSAVICESANRNFLRNSIHIGVPVIELPSVKSKVSQGDELEVNLKTGTIQNITTGETVKFAPYPDFLLEMIEAGGLYPLLREKLAKGEVPLYAQVPPPQ